MGLHDNNLSASLNDYDGTSGRDPLNKAWGAVGDGSTSDRTALYNLSQDIEANGYGAMVLRKPFLIDADLTIGPEVTPVFHRGGEFVVASGVTVTMPYPQAGIYQIFRYQHSSAAVEFNTPVEKLWAAWWGATGSGTADRDPFQYAATASASAYNATVAAHHGHYTVSGQVTFSQGTMFEGPGSQGSTQGYGCSIVHQSTGDCFVWDGSGASAAGTGGGIRNVLGLKQTGALGGDFLYLEAQGPSNRPGEFVIDNVLGYGQTGGRWDRGLHVDGTAASGTGNKGVRTIHLRKARFADCQIAQQTVFLNQAVHVEGEIEVDQGSQTVTPGITIAGDSENISLNLRVGGTVMVSGAATHVNLRGRIEDLLVDNASALGSFTGTVASGVINKSENFLLRSNKDSAFRAYLSSSVSNATGDGTEYTIVFDTEDFDKNLEFDTSTGIFTAKAAGRYSFYAQVTYSSVGASHTRHDTTLVHKDSGGSTIDSVPAVDNPYARSASGNAVVTIQADFNLSYGDTVQVNANVSGGAQTVTVFGNATQYTFFQGALR